MRPLFISLLLFLVWGTPSFAQRIKQHTQAIRSSSAHVERKQTSVKGKAAVRRQSVEKPDTVYCTSTRKQHGWFYPKHVVSKEFASHCSSYFVFTNKNSKGNWGKMEVRDGYGRLKSGQMQPYILNINSAESDKAASNTWVELVKTTCIFESVSDAEGSQVIQERAYDKDHNLVYTYSRTPIGEDSLGHKQFIGTYRDNAGLPAEMRVDSTNTFSYGTLVKLTEDVWGNDSVIEYLDSKGWRKLNANGVAMDVRIYNEDGNLIKGQSRDENGNLTIDNWGNCGYEYTYNEKGYCSSATYMDASWQPMRMPDLRDTYGNIGFIRENYKYDEYGRETEWTFSDADGNPDVNASGTHRLVQKYNTHGDRVELTGYDKDGNLAPFNKSLEAIRTATYDDNGNILQERHLDAQGKPLSTDGSVSKIDCEYDEQGNVINHKEYQGKGNEEILWYQDLKSKNFHYTQWGDGTYRIDSLDNKGRYTYEGFYDANGKLRMANEWAYATYRYDDNGKVTIENDAYYDASGNLIRRDCTITDSLACTMKFFFYDDKDNLTDTYMQLYDSSFEQLIAHYDSNCFGIPSRAGGSSEVMLYKADVDYGTRLTSNFAESLNTLIGKDEFGEPDYIVSPNLIYYYQKHRKGGGEIYDENNRQIYGTELKDSLVKVMSVEVTDSCAYRKGLKDNDVVLAFGDFVVNLDTIVSFNTFRREWDLHSVIGASKSKKMLVFRVNEDKSIEIKEIDGITGTPSENGFLTHVRYLTSRQTSRIRTLAESNDYYKSRKATDFRSFAGENMILISYPISYRTDRHMPYQKEIADPSVIIGRRVKDMGQRWYLNANDSLAILYNIANERNVKAQKYPIQDYYLTTDYQTIRRLSSTKPIFGFYFYGARVSDEVYNQLLRIGDSVKEDMELKPVDKQTLKKIYGSWTVPADTASQYPYEARVNLTKDGKAEVLTVNYAQLSQGGADIIIRIATRAIGTWKVSGNTVFISSNDKTREASCVSFHHPSISDDQEAEAIESMNNLLKECNEADLDKLNTVYYDMGNRLFINMADPRQPSLSDYVGDYTLEKCK